MARQVGLLDPVDHRAFASVHSDPEHGCCPRWLYHPVAGRFWLVDDELLGLVWHRDGDGIRREYFALWRGGEFVTHFEADLGYVLRTIRRKVEEHKRGRWQVLMASHKANKRKVDEYFGMVEGICETRIAQPSAPLHGSASSGW